MIPPLPRGAELHRQPPSPALLGEVCACGDTGCVPIATVTVPVGGLEWSDTAGGPCIPRLVDEALARVDDDAVVAVEVPLWNTVAIAADLELGPRGHRRVDAWARCGFLAPSDRFDSGSAYRNWFTADGVLHARQLLAASRVGLRVDAAHRLLTGTAADRRLVAAVVSRLSQPEEARAA